MAFVNLPANLQDIFGSITDRISKLESGPNQPMTYAQSAQTTAAQALADSAQGIAQAQAANALGVQAMTQATTALTQAQAAYALGTQSLIKDANTITNSNNNMTAINTGGVTVYSGASASTGARVVMNSAGIAGYNSGGTATFALLSSTGAFSTTGAIFTTSTISGGTLNINGNAIIDASGFLTATGATITGTITSSNATITGGSLTVGPSFQVTSAGVLTASGANITGSITATSGTFTGTIYAAAGGTLGGFTIGSNYLYSGNLSLYSTGDISGTGGATLFYTNIAVNGATLGSYKLAVQGDSGFVGDMTATGTITAQTNLNVNNSVTFGTSNTFQYLSSSGTLRSVYTYGRATSGRAMQISSAGDFGTTASTLRKKHEVKPYAIDTSKLLQLEPKTFKYLPELDELQEQQYGFIAEQAEELGLLPLILYDTEGRVDYFAYEKLPIFLLQLAQEQDKRLKLLEGK
jgi:hypothetical protein